MFNGYIKAVFYASMTKINCLLFINPKFVQWLPISLQSNQMQCRISVSCLSERRVDWFVWLFLIAVRKWSSPCNQVFRDNSIRFPPPTPPVGPAVIMMRCCPCRYIIPLLSPLRWTSSSASAFSRIPESYSPAPLDSRVRRKMASCGRSMSEEFHWTVVQFGRIPSVDRELLGSLVQDSTQWIHSHVLPVQKTWYDIAGHWSYMWFLRYFW